MVTNELCMLPDDMQDRLEAAHVGVEYKLVHAEMNDDWELPEASLCVATKSSLCFLRMYHASNGLEVVIDREVPISEINV